MDTVIVMDITLDAVVNVIHIHLVKLITMIVLVTQVNVLVTDTMQDVLESVTVINHVHVIQVSALVMDTMQELVIVILLLVSVKVILYMIIVYKMMIIQMVLFVIYGVLVIYVQGYNLVLL